MIRPIDIQEKQFSKGVRGYREDEVDKFLEELAAMAEKSNTAAAKSEPVKELA